MRQVGSCLSDLKFWEIDVLQRSDRTSEYLYFEENGDKWGEKLRKLVLTEDKCSNHKKKISDVGNGIKKKKINEGRLFENYFVVNVERFYRVCKPRDQRKIIFRDSNRMELCMSSGHKKCFSRGHNCKKELGVGCFSEMENYRSRSMFNPKTRNWQLMEATGDKR